MGITLADGSTHARLTARGMIQFDGKSEVGLILLEWQNTDILLGMDFLTKFGKQLKVDAINRTVEIGDAPAAIPAPAPAVAQPAAPITPMAIVPSPAPPAADPTQVNPTKNKKRGQLPNITSA